MLIEERKLYGKTLNHAFQHFSIVVKDTADIEEIQKIINYEIQNEIDKLIVKMFKTKVISPNEILLFFISMDEKYNWRDYIQNIIKKYMFDVQKIQNLNFNPLKI